MPPSSRRALLAALPPLAAPSVLRAQGTVRAVVSFPPGDGVARLLATGRTAMEEAVLRERCLPGLQAGGGGGPEAFGARPRERVARCSAMAPLAGIGAEEA